MIKNRSYIYGLVTLLIAFTVSFSTASAQKVADKASSLTQSLEGKVVDASKGQPLSNINVQLKELNKEATTDSQGMFTFEGLNSQSSANVEGMQSSSNQFTLVINHDGYKKLTKTINASDLQQSGSQSQPIVLKLEPKNEGVY